jgi:hypothetical protein
MFGVILTGHHAQAELNIQTTESGHPCKDQNAEKLLIAGSLIFKSP